MLSNKNKRILFRIIPFGTIPAIFSALQVILEKGILGSHPIYPSTGNPYESNFLVPVLTSFIIGLLMGLFEAFYVNKLFQNRSFIKKILVMFNKLCQIIKFNLGSTFFSRKAFERKQAFGEENVRVAFASIGHQYSNLF